MREHLSIFTITGGVELASIQYHRSAASCFCDFLTPIAPQISEIPLFMIAIVSGWRLLSFYRVNYYALCIIVWTWTCIMVRLLAGLLLFQRPCALYYSVGFSPFANFRFSLVVMLRDIWNAIVYILHELLADRTNFFAECSAEHHDLLAMGSAAENFLHIFAHIYGGERIIID